MAEAYGARMERSGIGRNGRSCGAYCPQGGNSVVDGVCAQGRKPEHIAGVEPVWSASGIGRNSRSCGAYCPLGGNSVADGVCAQGRKPEHIAGVEPVWSVAE